MLGIRAGESRPVYQPGRKYKWIAERELVLALAQNLVREFAALRASKGWLRGSLAALKKAMGDLDGLLTGKKVFGILKLRDPLPGAMMFLRLLVDACKFAATAIVRPAPVRLRVREMGKGDKPL